MIKPRMNFDRMNFGLAWFNGGFFAVGGDGGPSRLTETTQLLKDANPEGEWEENAPMKRSVDYMGDLVIL